MYIKQSVSRPAGNPGIGIQVRDQLTLIDVDDIAYMPARDDKGVVIADNIVMKPGRYGYNIYMTPGTVEITSAAEGETDQIGFTPSIKFNHPGNEQEVREFKVNSINRKFIIIVRYCSGKPADLIGSVCNPCKLTPSYTGNNESNTNEMTFQQISKGDDIAIYRGTVPQEEPAGSVTAAATTLNYVADGQYTTASGEAVIDKIEGGAHGAVVTILGTTGTAPTVSGTGEESNIVLKDGRVFTAAEGSQLTLKAFNNGSKLLWMEQSRYELA